MIERNFTKLSERRSIMLNDELGTNHVHWVDKTSKLQIWETVNHTENMEKCIWVKYKNWFKKHFPQSKIQKISHG